MDNDFSNLQIDIASLPRQEEVRLNRLQPRYLIKLHIQTSLSLIVFSGILAAVHFFIQPQNFLFIIFTIFLILVFGWSYFTNFQLIKRNGYALRERDLVYKKGFLFEKTTVVPFNRIQHVSVERSFLDKLLNLSSLKVFTAGGSGSDVSIPGLSPENATRVKEELSERISSYV